MHVKDELIRAIVAEIRLQKDYLHGEQINTIYFGGGTPSILSMQEIDSLLHTVFHNFSIDENAEISFECNPDDLSVSKLTGLYKSGINRLSIGIQSFNNAQLEFLHRTHDAHGAIESYDRARSIGFSNISLDLIYGIPAPDNKIWEEDLERIVSMAPQHISSYCLTIEPMTVFGNWVSKNKLKPVSDEFAAEQLELSMQILSCAGYDQYEISNFAQPGYYSRHNSAYWLNEKYLGIGPGAHSFDGTSRQFNVQNNHKYLRGIKERIVPFEKEVLTKENRANEYLMTGLRTKWGFNLVKLKEEYGYDIMYAAGKIVRQLKDKGFLLQEGSVIKLSDSGKLLTDQITADLFWV